MADLEVARWRNYGKDRLYVKDAAAINVGWVDLVSGQEVIEQPERAEEFHNAVTAWRATNDLPVLAEPTTQIVEQVTLVEPPEPPTSRDLSLNRPGEAVRAKAAEEWEAAKDRSKFFAYAGRVLDVKTDERAWRVGAQGEEKVGPKLEKLLPHGWRVLHSVPVGKGDSDIDHVLIGPGGVFTINSKYHPRSKVWVARYQIRINGEPVNYLRNSRFEGERASRLLTKAAGFPVEVTPCLIILTGGLEPNITYKQQPDDVLVLDSWDVPRVFKRRTGVLTPEQVDAVFEVARWEGTWR